MWTQAWALVWMVSTFVQVVGFGWANWRWWQAKELHFKYFWLTFSINWTATLAHQLTTGYAPDLTQPFILMEAALKFSAMLAEIVMMWIAHRLEQHFVQRG